MLRAREGIVLEHGPLLRILLGREATAGDLLRAVQAARDHADQMIAIGTSLGHEYLERRHSNQQEVHLRALTFDYLYRWAPFNSDWATRTEAELRRWTDTGPSTAKHRRALERIRHALNQQTDEEAA